MKDDILNLTKQLITYPTYEGNSQAMRDCIQLVKEYFDDTKNVVVEEFASNGIPSLLLSIGDKKRHFEILLNGHLDVVPAPEGMFSPIEKDGRLYGRGAADMKGMVAVMMAAFKEAAREDVESVGLMLVFDEEIGGFDGTKYLVEKQHVTADIVLIPDDMGNFELTLKEKGMVTVDLVFKGKAAHSCEPWQGESAVDALVAFGTEIRKQFPKPKQEAWVTTCNIGPVHAYNARNQLADELTASLDIRFTEDITPEKIIAIIEGLAKKHGATMDIIFQDAAVFTPLDHPKVQEFKKAAEEVLRYEVKTTVDHGASDARHFAKHTTPAFLFKSPSWGMHSSSESVDVEGMDVFYDILVIFLIHSDRK